MQEDERFVMQEVQVGERSGVFDVHQSIDKANLFLFIPSCCADQVENFQTNYRSGFAFCMQLMLDLRLIMHL